MRLGIDVGGTFTDLLLHDDATGRTWQAKTPSTPADQSVGVMEGIRLVSRIAGITPNDISVVLHGTTVATNAVLEGKGARVGLLVTEGFEYVLHLAKSWTPGPLFGWIVMDKPDPPASLDDTRAVAERMDAKGRVLRPLDIAQATAAIDALCTSGIEALTISLMHAYANPAHERALGAIVAARFPDLPVSLSSDILPEFREYDRTITTVINDYVRPVMRRYLSRIEGRMAAEGMAARLHIVRSDGGLMTAKAAAERPVHTVLSGPAGGVTSTVMLARQTGRPNLLGFDMGGTSTDVAVVLAGEPQISRTTEVGSFPAKVPTLDVRSVGAGGGSIAEVSDLTSSLRVGPRSAGAVPGPVAYGRGGTEPAVSDANVVLGYLSPTLLDGSMTLDVDGARAAVAALGARIGLGPEQAAQGILDIANETMLGALRVITVQRGLDPRDFGLVAFGGAGPLHGNAMAAVLGCYPVVIPTRPGVFSALGFVQSEFKNEFTRTLIRTASALDPAELWRTVDELAAQATEWLEGESIDAADRRLGAVIDMRYAQQGFEVPVSVPAEAMAARDMDALIARYHARHEQMYGVRFDVDVELVAVRVVATGRTPGLRETAWPVAPGPSTKGTRPCFFAGAWHDTPLHDRARLVPGVTVRGPAIIDQYDTTTVVLPGHRLEVDAFGNLLIWPETP